MFSRLRYAVFAGIFLLLTACSASKTPTTITFMTSGDPAERDAYLELVAAFEEAHPEIHVEVTHIPSDKDYRTRLATDFAAGTPIDITLMNYRRIAGFAAAGFFAAPLAEAAFGFVVVDRVVLAIENSPRYRLRPVSSRFSMKIE